MSLNSSSSNHSPGSALPFALHWRRYPLEECQYILSAHKSIIIIVIIIIILHSTGWVGLFIGSGLSQFGKKNISDFLEYLDQDTYRVLFDWFPIASFCILGFKETGSSPGYWFHPRRWINSCNS